jgi:LPS-assembly protein
VPFCHGKSSSGFCTFPVSALCALFLAAHAFAQVTTLQPDQRILPTRPNAPPRGTYDIDATTQESDGSLRHLHGKARIEGATMLLQADDIDYNEDTGDLRAVGNVYFHSFEKNEQLWADRLDYNTDSETGTFYKVRGQGYTRIDARPGRLTSAEPFFFQGEWAERQEDHYILHNGFITNCKMPNPWWELRGPKFYIVPNDHAVAYRSVFWVRKVPLFFTPYFYKSLEKVPRRSGFLIPNFGTSSTRGFMLGVGYFWAINRSYDLLVHLTEYTSRGEAPRMEFRAKPKDGTDFDAIVFGVHDRGVPGTNPVQQYSGVSITAQGRMDFGDGWKGRLSVNYISSFNFRQQWSESFNEAVATEVHSIGYLGKNWSDYTLNVVAARLENFQSGELPVTDPVTGETQTETNAVLIRKLPEVQFSGRVHQLGHLPLWFSFDSSTGLMYREQPLFDFNGSLYQYNLLERYQTSQFMNRTNLAPSVMSAFHLGAVHFAPRFGIQETYYSQSQSFNPSASQILNQPVYQVVGTDLVRSVRAVSMDVVFPSLERVFQKKTIFGDKLKHVIEPRATYKYVSGIGTDFSRFIRFDETDIVANTNELVLSLTNRIYAKRGNSVDEVFTWELSQARYFDPTFGGALVPGQRNVFLTTEELSAYAFLVNPRSASPIISVLRASPVNRLGIQWRADFDPQTTRLVNSTLSVDYRWSKYFISAGDNLVHTNPVLSTPENQLHFRAGFGDITRRGLNAGVDAIYDIRIQALQYTTVQATYNTDCCGISVQYRLFNIGPRNEGQFRVSFSVANLGTFGTLRKQDRIF